MVEPGPPRRTLAVGQLADRVHRQHQRRERETVLPLTEPVIDENIQRAVRSHMMPRSEEHTSELQSLMRISYAVFCLKKKNTKTKTQKMNTAYKDTRTIRTKINKHT